MTSRLIADRQRAADTVAAIAQAQADTIDVQLANLTQSSAPRRWADLVDQLVTALRRARNVMLAADQEYRSDRGDASHPDRLGDLANRLFDRTAEFRRVIHQLYGDATARRVAQGPTPEAPEVLVRFASEVANHLRDFDLPQPTIPGARLDTTELADELDRLRVRLERELAFESGNADRSKATRIARADAVHAYDRAFLGVATVLSGLFLLAHEDELAERVRPSQRLPGRTAEQETLEFSTRRSTLPR